ncbi:MAG: hypothetical protein CMC96_12470 [Flavobacteriales bacterium]|nr:hypothetical protein [Flavobacteriales bacterium]|tara:strand:- start:12238 stop:12888 length:651 start_codon:yes stop_codon:yes gene_type:complete
MELFIQFTLFVHVFAGGLALLSGIVAILSKKGQNIHIKSGRIYYWSMMTVIITAVIVSTFRENAFLQSIAVFSFYLAFTGKRLLRYKKAISPKPIDWIISSIALVVAIGMLSAAINIMIQYGFAGEAPVLLIFGFFLFSMCFQDLIKMKRKKFVKNAWLFDHIGRMSGSFIATTTAFIVVNFSMTPAWVLWLLPTAIGTPLIFMVSAKWKRKIGTY